MPSKMYDYVFFVCTYMYMYMYMYYTYLYCVCIFIIVADSTVPLTIGTNIVLYVAAGVVLLSAGARLAVEVLQLMKRLSHYLLNVENYIEWLTYGFSIVFVSQFGSNCWCPTNWQWQLGAIAVFLAWINLILFLKRLPLLGIYVLMFNTILYTFLKFALIAFLFVVAFCISFYMILYKAVIVSGSTFMRVYIRMYIHINVYIINIHTPD